MADVLTLGALLIGVALVARRSAAAAQRLRRLSKFTTPARTPRRLPALPLRRARPADDLDRQAIADLVGRLAALTRAGVADGRSWQILATGSGPGSRLARVTADMVASGGSTADGLRLAIRRWSSAHGPPGALDAVAWLALTTDVVERSGAPSAVVYDGMATGVLSELARIDEQEVALAGTRTTAAMLAALPLAGAGLGLLMGANVVAVLVGTPIGRLCLVAGVTAWVVGRWWTNRLVRAAASAED